MINKKFNRILSALLAVLMIFSCLPMFTFAELLTEEFRISYEGDAIDAITFDIHERKTVTAENLPEGSTYQWQIQIPESDYWVDIQGQGQQNLNVSYALVGSLLDNNDTACVRCAAVGSGETVYTDPLWATVTLAPEHASEEEDGGTVAPMEATEEATEATEESTETTEEATEATEESTETTEEATEATEETTEATEETTEATEEATEATEETTEASEEATEATEETTETTEEATEATEETVDAADETTDANEEAAVLSEAKVTEATENTDEAATATREVEETFASSKVELGTTEATETTEVAESPAILALSRSSNSGSTDENAEIVGVIIHYVYWDRETDQPGDQFWSDFSVYDTQGFRFHELVPNKVVPGCKPELAENSPAGATLVKADGTALTEGYVGPTAVKVELDNVEETTEFTVYYKEIMVPYYARYFLQNVYNDMYVEDVSLAQAFMGYQDDNPQIYDDPDNNLKGIYQDIKGFTALFHQPDTIAADGSTVFEVYCDRNYYLMNFDMDGGFGTAPVYARYESAFNVSQPTKAGYRFDGWELITVNGKPATADQKSQVFPTHIPAENRTYQAKWVSTKANASIAYWIENADGTYSYLGGRPVRTTSGVPVTIENDLGQNDVTKDAGAKCGHINHTSHDTSCMRCQQIHTRENCYMPYAMVNPTWDEQQLFNAFGTGEPKTNYAYVINVEGDPSYPKYYIPYRESNGTIHWHYTPDNRCISGEPLATATYTSGTTTYTATKYNAKLACGHAHSSACYDIVCNLQLHSHNSKCFVDATQMIYLEDLSDKSITVTGDGAAVANVYYRYKEYTLKFYYAKISGGTDTNNDNIPDKDYKTWVPGGSTWPFGYYAGYSSDTSVEESLERVGNWGEVNALPTFKRNEDDYEHGVEKYVDGNNNVFYYYFFSFTARYGDDISQLWPCDVLSSTTRKDVTGQFWTGTTATVSAWNGEHCVKYTQDNPNPTIKGLYEKLDENLLFDTVRFPHKANENVVSYLCFWENGAYLGETVNAQWNVPELYRYQIFLEALPGENLDGKTTVTMEKLDPDGNPILDENGDPVIATFILKETYDVCDDSNIQNQTDTARTGFYSHLTDWGVLFLDEVTYNQYTNVYTGPGKEPTTYSPNKATKQVQSGSWYQTQTLSTHTVNNKTMLYDQSLYNPDVNKEHESYREGYFRNFYYARYEHTFNFWNKNDYMVNGDGEKFLFGTPLIKFAPSDDPSFMVNGYTDSDGNKHGPFYPAGLEPGAYTFKGWYETSEFYENTKVNWGEKTMPDHDVTVYALWEPIQYNTYFYMDYDDLKSDHYFQSVQGTKHGERMKTDGLNLTPSKGIDGYHFAGWFYLDGGGNKVAFNPAEMAVRRELHLYAEWTSSISVSYTVQYVLGDENGNILYRRKRDDQGNFVYENGSPVYELDEKGNKIPIKVADDELGYGFEATTRTVKAKPGDQLNLLEGIPQDEIPDYGLTGNDPPIWLPNVSSHSEVLKGLDGDGNNPNKYTFIYTAKTNVPYRVKYLNAVTGEPVRDDKYVASNRAVMVTERFVYVEGYIPDNFHKTLILSTNDTENVITFLYNVDETYIEGEGTGSDPQQESALYKVNYWKQDADNPNLFVVDPYETGKGIVGTTALATVKPFVGYTYQESITTENGTTYTSTIEGTIVKDGLELDLYYSRNLCDYTIRYLEYGTDKSLITPENSSQYEQTGKEYYKKDLIKTAPDFPGYALYSSSPQRVNISHDSSQNVITFYYTPLPVTINYVAVLRNSQAVAFGKLSRTSEVFTAQGNINGCNAMPESGFRFVGWYKEETCETLILNNLRLVPVIDATANTSEYYYYSLFEPITLTIKQSGLQKNETGIYKIEGNGISLVVSIPGSQDKITLEQIPVGEYTITELTDWTWKNGIITNQKNITISATAENEVSFSFDLSTSDWLHGETYKENIFARVQKND